MTQFGLTAIGNAIVDVLAPATDEFIQSQASFGMVKGGMALIDADRAKALYQLMGPATEMSGGSAGNTMAAFASFGGRGAYIGKVADDQLGGVFTHDIRAIGVHFDTPALKHGAPTAQCLILVTPDAQRTMNTFLGACVTLGPDDVDEKIIAQSAITYLEGYLFDPPQAKKAFYKAAEITAKNKRRLSLTLSDSFCVHRHRDDFKALIQDHVDILFANEEELKALTERESFDDAVTSIRDMTKPGAIVAVTRSAQGSIAIGSEGVTTIAPVKPSALVDTTGAGDAYAAGFLYGLSEGLSLAQCGNLGSVAASEVISHMGPRPQKSLKSLIDRAAA